MKRYIVMAALSLAVLPMAAQDVYDNARMLGYDLNGTARYVGMGGALEALGADISTISTNPAGVGMFRHSTASLSFGAVSQQGVKKFDNLNKTCMSFDQIGFVYSNRTGESSYINFAFNYHKSKNFDQILSATNRLGRSSVNNLVYIKDAIGSAANGGYYLDTNKDGHWMGWRTDHSDVISNSFTQLDEMYANAYTMDDKTLPGNAFTRPEVADDYYFDRSHRGWIADYDFNLSGNVNNRFFWGVTLGLHTVKYHGYSFYDEGYYFVDNATGEEKPVSLSLEDERWIDAKGVDLKFGVIFLPVEDSPFRVGLSMATPTWYDVTSENRSRLNNDLYAEGINNWGLSSYTMPSTIYDFKYYTPWKFGLSLGHTIDNYLALGASYEYTAMGSASTRVYNGRYNYYDQEETDPDYLMDSHNERTLNGVSLLKVGAEFKPDPAIAVRLGYNYQSAIFNENGFKDTTLDSPSNAYVSTADYTNWKATNRITCGLGYKLDHLNLDLAYQYSVTNGTFYPFQSNLSTNAIPAGSNWDGTNIATPTDVSFKRHQVLFTIGYTF